MDLSLLMDKLALGKHTQFKGRVLTIMTGIELTKVNVAYFQDALNTCSNRSIRSKTYTQ